MFVNWIDQLQPAPREALRASMIRRLFPRGALVYGRNEQPQGIFVIREGIAAFFLDRPGGERLLIKHFRANEIFGETVAFDSRPAPASIEAREPLVVDVVPTQRLRELHGTYPEIRAALADVAARNLRRTLALLGDLVLLPLREKVHGHLRRMADDIGMAPGAPADLEVTQSELAAMLGASRQSVNAELARLETSGVIERRFGLIRLLGEAGA
jgi:CRP-like cAMP-binding protein